MMVMVMMMMMMMVSQTVRCSGGAGIFNQDININFNDGRQDEAFGKLIRSRFKLQRESFLLSARVKEFSIPQSFQTGSESQSAASPVSTVGVFTGSKRQSYDLAS